MKLRPRLSLLQVMDAFVTRDGDGGVLVAEAAGAAPRRCFPAAGAAAAPPRACAPRRAPPCTADAAIASWVEAYALAAWPNWSLLSTAFYGAPAGGDGAPGARAPPARARSRAPQRGTRR